MEFGAIITKMLLLAFIIIKFKMPFIFEYIFRVYKALKPVYT